MKLEKFIIFNIKVKTLTGLHIGSWNADIEIGWVDNPVIKTKDGFPYIPWSSLKGKLRSLYELKTWKITDNSWKEWKYGDVYHLTEEDFDNNDKKALFISKMFGCVLDKDLDKKEKKWDILTKIWSTRAIFRDLFITDEFKEKLKEYKEKTWNMFENKAEVALARYGFKSGWLRNIERIPAWIEFEWKIIVRVFDVDKKDVDSFQEELKKLLEEDLTNEYLGWGWTRWNWQVEVEVIIEEKEI